MPPIQELRRRLRELHVTVVVPRGDKVSRAHAIMPMFEVVTISAMSDAGIFHSYAKTVIQERQEFPNGASDDLVDSTTMALRWFRDGDLRFIAGDSEDPQSYRERVPLY